MRHWKIVLEGNDENDNPTLWATEINHSTYGRFAWIVKENDNCFSVEINNKGNEFTSLAKCNSLNNAKRWVSSHIINEIEAAEEELEI